jgi:riboflavin kinase/FMN adenylyltransferase
MLTFGDVRQAHLAGPTYLAIGNFDGIHRGHQALIDRVCMLAAADPSGRAQTALLTFDPHPLAVLRPEQPYLLLTSPNERLALAAGHGIEVGVVHPFHARNGADGSHVSSLSCCANISIWLLW